jgi:hypothetical protein
VQGFDKQALLGDLRARVAQDLTALERRQRDAQAGSTHEESRSEHAKDTRATEQSYLARGLAERVEALRRATAALASMALCNFADDDPIAVTALVSISTRGGGDESGDGDANGADGGTWWLIPAAGGFELPHGGGVVRTLTPTSPLGRALLGLVVDDQGVFRTPRGEREFRVRGVA